MPKAAGGPFLARPLFGDVQGLLDFVLGRKMERHSNLLWLDHKVSLEKLHVLSKVDACPHQAFKCSMKDTLL